VRFELVNRGARMAPGRLRLFTRDPQVSGFPETTIDVPAVGPLQTIPLDLQLPISLRTGAGASRRPVFVEGELTAGGDVYRLSAPVLTEGTVILREGFESEPPGLTAYSVRPGGPVPWRRLDNDASEGRWSYGTRGEGESYAARTDAVMVLGPYRIDGPAELRFRQKYNTQAIAGYVQDGGFLEASDDLGATWTPLTPVGGYPMLFDYTDGNDYPTRPAWGGLQESWEEVRVPVTGFRGETFLRFHFVSDNTGAGFTYGGWFIDEVLLRGWDRNYSAVFDEPERDGDDLRIGFSVLSLVDEGPETEAVLVRERGGTRTEEGRWTVTGRRDLAATVEAVPRGWTDRFWVEWSNGDPAAGPLPVASEDGPGAELLEGTPAVLRSGAAGTIRYRVPGEDTVPAVLDLFDVRGALVSRLVDDLRTPGSHEIAWRGSTAAGGAVASGVYFLRLRAGGRSDTRRVVVVP
jgi:hypothetical protein